MKDSPQYTPNKPTTKRKKRNSFIKVIRYYFDNSMTKSGNFVILILTLGILMGFLMVFLQNALKPDDTKDFFTLWWEKSANILKLGKGNTWPDRILGFVSMACQIALAGTIIGFLSSNIRELVAKLKKGKSTVIVKNHIVILGWSNNIFSILKQLSTANENVKNSTVVIFSPLDNEKMQEELKAIADDTKGLRIVTRSGNPGSTTDLEITNPHEAKSIIVLNENGEHDPQVITTVLALGSMLENKKIPIIASLKSRAYAEVITDLQQFHILPVLAEEIISNVTAQACRERGLGLVFLDLLDFDGDEIYFKKESVLNGKTYQEALVSYEKSSVIGLMRGKEVQLNPDHDTIIDSNDQLICISEDDDTMHYKEMDLSKFTDFKKPVYEGNRRARNVLFVGWSGTGNVILEALVPTLSPESNVIIAYQESFVDAGTLPDTEAERPISLSLLDVGEDFGNITSILDSNELDEVMIVGYAEELSIEQADTTTLMYMLQLDSYLNKNAEKSFRVVAQVLDSSKAKLAQFTRTDELIISDNLSGLLMAQLCENPELEYVFDHLFDESNSNINIYPISKYMEPGQKVSYEQLVYIAASYNESAIGFRRDTDDDDTHLAGLNLNPAKKTELEITNQDFLIVIDHDHA